MLRIFPNLEALSRGAADLFALESQRAVASRGRFAVALSGGITPRRTYELLAQPPWQDEVPWAGVEVFWVDERCVPLSHPQSNAGMAGAVWLDKVPIPREQVYPMVCSGGASALNGKADQVEEQARAGARRYEELLGTRFAEQPPRFDLIILGLGGDGHTASLFPGSPVLAERERWVRAVPGPDRGGFRVTLTLPVLNRARLVVFLATGRAKAQILQAVLEGPPKPNFLPAQAVHPDLGQVLWLVDQEAAAQLSQRQ